jgi:hypothetical protein
LILYLPPGPSTAIADSPLPPFLFTSGFPVVRINYRWADHRFPTPIHDVTFAYDWVLSNLVSNSGPRRQVAIYGSQLGGTLATSLALTESRIGRRGSIAALAVKDSIFDWSPLTVPETDLPTVKSPKKKRGCASSTPASVEDVERKRLAALMPDLFKTPDSCFDPFASPILFFRTAGLDVAPSFGWTPGSDNEESLNILEASQSTSDDEALASKDPTIEDVLIGTQARRTNLRFPPRSSGLRIPFSRIRVTGDSPFLFEQGQEMARLLQRSILMHELKDRSLWGEEVDAGEAELRVQLVESEDGSASAEKVDDDPGAGEWFRDCLD